MSPETNVKAECVESTDTYGRFVAEPLEQGEGTTMGNALRRVLLSSLPGAAVTWVRIDGVQHDFSTIPHMKEDTQEFLLNIKALRLRSLSQHPGRLTLEVAGEGNVTAADITPSTDFDVVNPELPLATLDAPEAKLLVELNVELGKGYIPAGHGNGQPIGIIPVDAIFTPVRKVNYTVEPVLIGQESSYERLNLEVWTDGTLSPREAVAKSAQQLMERFSLFGGLSAVVAAPQEKPSLHAALPEEEYNMSLEKLKFSVRTYNCLRRGGITTLGELLSKSEEELQALRHFGEKSRQEVEEKLQLMGYVLPIKGPAPRESPQAAPVAETPQGKDHEA